MANASVETVTKTITEEVDEQVTQLTLSRTEARALYALTLFVNGSTEDTYNREITAIRNALISAGRLGYVRYHKMFGFDWQDQLQAMGHLDADK